MSLLWTWNNMQTDTTHNLQIDCHTGSDSQTDRVSGYKAQLVSLACRRLPSHRLENSRLMWMRELRHDFPNEWRLRKLEIFKTITEMIWNDGEYAAGHPKGKFWKSKMCFLKKGKAVVIMRLRIRLLILMRLTTKRDNLMRLCGRRTPYTWPPFNVM